MCIIFEVIMYTYMQVIFIKFKDDCLYFMCISVSQMFKVEYFKLLNDLL